MQAFAAVLLIWLGTVPRESCDGAAANDVRSIVVDSELGCNAG